jgi:hypothetical protein
VTATRPMVWLLQNDDVDALAREIAVAAGFETNRAVALAKYVARERPKTISRLCVLLGGVA